VRLNLKNCLYGGARLSGSGGGAVARIMGAMLALLASHPLDRLMSAITIRNLNGAVVTAIKRRAAEKGISMEEEVRQLLASTYADDRQQRGREWARRQLTLLKRGEIPLARTGSVAELRAMRRERTERLARLSKGRNERRR
jgi:plasmid stability protein